MTAEGKAVSRHAKPNALRDFLTRSSLALWAEFCMISASESTPTQHTRRATSVAHLAGDGARWCAGSPVAAVRREFAKRSARQSRTVSRRRAHRLSARFFNATIRSLRTIDDLSQTQQAQRHLTKQRICKSTLSDSNKLADPERLRPIIDQLRSALARNAGPRPPSDVHGFLKQILAVDGT